MLAQQQNPHAIPYSLQQQQNDSKEMNSEGEAYVKTFSIRQYVFACRQISVFESWPFPEKYLKMCLDRGLKNVLPPFGLCSNGNNDSISESSSHNNGITIPNLNDPCDDQDYDDKNIGVFKSESPQHRPHHPLELKKKQNIVNHSDSGFLSNNEEKPKAMHEDGDCVNMCSPIIEKCAPKASSKLERRRKKGRCKKRSMADILAEAKHCTWEEINRINQFSYAAAADIIEGYCHDDETAPDLDNDPKRTETYYDLEGANFDVHVTCTS